jgi:hypothetical protein
VLAADALYAAATSSTLEAGWLQRAEEASKRRFRGQFVSRSRHFDVGLLEWLEAHKSEYKSMMHSSQSRSAPPRADQTNSSEMISKFPHRKTTRYCAKDLFFHCEALLPDLGSRGDDHDGLMPPIASPGFLILAMPFGITLDGGG